MERKLRRCKKITRKHATLKCEEYSDVEDDMARQKSEVVSSAREQTKDQKRKKPTRERWLLTRKTWRYMADAGRRLIPEGTQNRVEDIPKLEAYFQDVCQKEKKFLLWRKSSYPGALNFRVHRKKQRDRKKWGSYRETTSSTDEAEHQKRLFDVETKSGGRFDIQKLRQQFLESGPSGIRTSEDYAVKQRTGKQCPDQKWLLPDVPECAATQQENVSRQDDYQELMETLLYLVSREQVEASVKTDKEQHKEVDYTKFIYQLKKYLSQEDNSPAQTGNERKPQITHDTTMEPLTRPASDSNSFSLQYSFRNGSKTNDSTEKNRKILDTDDFEENHDRVKLKSTPQTTKEKYYSYGHERINLRKNDGSATSSLENTSVGRTVKTRGAYQSDPQTASGSSYRLGKLDSDMYKRAAPVHSAGQNIARLDAHSSHKVSRTASGNVLFEGDHLQKRLVEALSRYYSKSGSRDKVISDILTDRKMLEKLYFDLRKARNFKGRGGQTEVQDMDKYKWESPTNKMYDVKSETGGYDHEVSQNMSWKGGDKTAVKRPSELPLHPQPPAIEVQLEEDASYMSRAMQTFPVPQDLMTAIEDFLRREREKVVEQKEEREEHELKPPPVTTRRRSSVDHDDVSPSVSDTIKRYLKMARKKSVDADKVDRFKRVNYDRNLRNIKPKGEWGSPGDDDGLSKGCQTEETWVAALKVLGSDEALVSLEVATSDECPPAKPHSPGLLTSGQSFLSNLLHGRLHHESSQPSSPVAAGAAMQKSKSSSSVGHHGSRLVSKKMWRARSKSQSRAVPSITCTWTPQGHCVWGNVTGAQVTLSDTSLVQLTDLERRVLQKVALAKLQALNLGVTVRVPTETLAGDTVQAHKPKRRAHLLKRKALTTSFFDSVAGKDKDGVVATGLVFGIPISQCLENDRLSRGVRGTCLLEEEQACLRRKSHHSIRSSFSSLTETTCPAVGSCESLVSPELVAGSIPGLLDTLSSASAADLSLSGLVDHEPGVPSLVTSCFRHLEAHGLHTLGIFRVSSSKKRVRQLREDLDTGKETELDGEVCPHDVATLLKEFFRDLPEPLLCRDLYHAFLQTQRIRNRRLQFEALQHLVQQLPVPNRDTLWALLAFLSKVARHADDYTDDKGESVSGNKMDSSNLATLFAPNILHRVRPTGSKDMSPETAEERVDAISVVRTMIDHHQTLFTVPAELLDEVYLHIMDSYPETLDLLLRKRGLMADRSMDELDSSGKEVTEQGHATVRRTWSREEFLHESAGMGGPDVGMRPRHKEREHTRLRRSNKHWWEETRAAGSDAEGTSSDTGSSAPEDARRKSSPLLLDAVITASLKIPTSFSREEPDITFVEDVAASHRQLAAGGQRSTTTTATTTTVRHISTSGSDSSSVLPAPRTISPPSSISPPASSWASSPPNSPDDTADHTAGGPRQQRAVALTTKEIMPVILHKVTFASTGSEQRAQLPSQLGELPKSASLSAIVPGREQLVPASISSIGGAVMRSKTADIERILRIRKPAEQQATTEPHVPEAPEHAAGKKYSKRRYTDSRHQTRHIPDSDALEASAAPGQPQVSVYKRRELIASDPKKHETLL